MALSRAARSESAIRWISRACRFGLACIENHFALSSPIRLPHRLFAFLVIGALLLAAFCAPLIDKSTYINLYDGSVRCDSTLFGFRLSCKPLASHFSQLVESLGAGDEAHERWVLCHSSSANIFGVTVLRATPRYEGLPACLEQAARMVEGQKNAATGELERLPLSSAGKRAFVQRLLEACRLGKDDRLGATYAVRSSSVLRSYDKPAGPDDFPSVSEALNKRNWELNWEPRTR